MHFKPIQPAHSQIICHLPLSTKSEVTNTFFIIMFHKKLVTFQKGQSILTRHVAKDKIFVSIISLLMFLVRVF